MSKRTKNYDCFLIKGRSMLPTIKPNQKIKILRTTDFKVGDIAVFKEKILIKKNKKNNKTVHRIVKIDGSKIITKGDNLYLHDKPITYEKILGKVIKIGNKRVDTLYYNFINPFIAKISYYSMKISPISYGPIRKTYNYLNGLKMKLIGERKLYITFFLSLPHKINYIIFQFLKK